MWCARRRAAPLLLTLTLCASCTTDTGAGGAATTAQSRTGSPTAPVALPATAPAAFTACLGAGQEVTDGTEELSRVDLSDGEMTINRKRGSTWQLEASDVPDPRLVGTWYISANTDQYTVPGGAPAPAISAITYRIETDVGAWQGSQMSIQSPDVEDSRLSIVLIGEGDYKGLAAVGTTDASTGCPNIRGYIIDGSVPAPPTPNTGR